MNARPLFVTDCDEVLLHMVRHFSSWLEEEQDVLFRPEQGDMATALRYKVNGEIVPKDQIWTYLGRFFESEMRRQTLVPGALEALGRIGEAADIVILTNLPHKAHGWRVDQLARHGIRHEIVCNSGGKGEPLKRLVERHGANRSVFVDDLPQHHRSVAEHSPETQRLHMIAEPTLAAVMAPAEHAHARIDDWATATPWILERLESQS